MKYKTLVFIYTMVIAIAAIAGIILALALYKAAAG